MTAIDDLIGFDGSQANLIIFLGENGNFVFHGGVFSLTGIAHYATYFFSWRIPASFGRAGAFLKKKRASPRRFDEGTTPSLSRPWVTYDR